MARNDVYLNINALSPADAVVTGQQDMTAATVPELVLGDTPTFNFYFTDNTNVWPSWAGNTSYSLTWALSDAVAGDFSPAATTGNATPITGGWSVVLPLNSYDLVGLLNTKRVGQPYPVTNLWQQLRVTDPSGNEITRAMFWTPVRYRAISDTQNTESASPTGGRFVTVNNVNTLTTPTAAQFYAANPVPTSALGTAANGELLIGNGTGFTKSTLTAGTGITVTNGSGSITIDASGAQETLTATVKNAESVAITKGQVVYLFGATGGFASVKLAYNTSDATSAKTFGVVSSTSIAANGTGTVTCVGVVDGLNLGAYNDGDTLYLGATAGSVTATKPYAPNHLVYVGIVERANNGNGELYVRVQNGYELDEIHDVQINAPKLAGQTLIYDQTNDLWKNARLTGTANQITVTNADAAVTLSIPTNPTLPGNLTVSGTGTSTFAGNLTVSGGTIGTAAATNLTLTGGSSGASLVLAQGSSDATALTANVSLYLQKAAGSAIVFRNNAAGSYTEAMRIAGTTGNLLLGTTTDGGQKLQVNGTALFGTDNASLGAYFDYNGGISGNATLWLKQTTKSSSTYTLTGGGTYTALNAPSGGSIYLRINNSDALTLDSSQNATFAGVVVVGGGNASSGTLAVNYSSAVREPIAIVNSAVGGKYWYIGDGTGTSNGIFGIRSGSDAKTVFTITGAGNATFAGTISPQQAATASAPTYVKGAIYFDTTLNKLRVGGATGWETITSV